MHVTIPHKRTSSSRLAVDVAIICALLIEADAVEALFDLRLDDLDKAPGDPNAYSVGVIGRNNVVLAHLPGMGNNSAFVFPRCLFRPLSQRLVFAVASIAPKGPQCSRTVSN